MAGDKDPLKQLKDLTLLKKQLEEIQRRVESEISTEVPQLLGGVFSTPPMYIWPHCYCNLQATPPKKCVK